MTTPEQSNIMRAAMFLVRYGHMSLREVLDLKTDVLHLAAEKLGQLLREELDTSPVREVFRPDGVDPAYLGPAAQRYEAEASARLSGRACIVVVSPDGQPVHDVVVGRPITLRNDDNSGVRAWRWTLLSKPEGSTALENPTSSKVNFAPDVAGTYVVRLQVNGAELASMRSEVQLHVVAATPAPEMVIAEVDGARRMATSPARQSLSFVDAAGRSILLRGRCMPESAGVDSGTWTYSGTWRTAQVEADAAVFSGWKPGELDLSKCDALVLAEAFHYLQRAATTVQLIHNDKSRFGIIGDFKASMTGTEARWSLHFALAQDTAVAPERPGLVRDSSVDIKGNEWTPVSNSHLNHVHLLRDEWMAISDLFNKLSPADRARFATDTLPAMVHSLLVRWQCWRAWAYDRIPKVSRDDLDQNDESLRYELTERLQPSPAMPVLADLDASRAIATVAAFVQRHTGLSTTELAHMSPADLFDLADTALKQDRQQAHEEMNARTKRRLDQWEEINALALELDLRSENPDDTLSTTIRRKLTSSSDVAVLRRLTEDHSVESNKAAELDRIRDLLHERYLQLCIRDKDAPPTLVDVVRGLINDAHVPSVDARDMTDLRARAEAAEAELAQYRNLGLSENWGRLREVLGVGQAANWPAVLEAAERVNKYKALADTAVETVDKLRITAPELLDLHTFVSRELAPLDPDLDRKNGESDIAWATRLLRAARGRGAFRLPTPRT